MAWPRPSRALSGRARHAEYSATAPGDGNNLRCGAECSPTRPPVECLRTNRCLHTAEGCAESSRRVRDCLQPPSRAFFYGRTNLIREDVSRDGNDVPPTKPRMTLRHHASAQSQPHAGPTALARRRSWLRSTSLLVLAHPCSSAMDPSPKWRSTVAELPGSPDAAPQLRRRRRSPAARATLAARCQERRVAASSV